MNSGFLSKSSTHRINEISIRFRTSVALLACCLLMLVAPTSIQALCLPHTTTYLKLDELSNSIFADESQNGIGASCISCPAVINGRISKARFFSSVGNSSIQSIYSSKLNWSTNQNFSVEFWFKHSTTIPVDIETIVGRVDESSQMRWQIGMNLNGRIFADFIATDGSGSSASIVSPISLNDNLWHHIAFVRNSSEQRNKLYVDGQLSSSTTVSYSSGFSSDTAVFEIGALNDDMFFNGIIDEVSILTSSLSESQILQHYNDGNVGLRFGYCGSDDDIRIMPLGDSITSGTTATITDPTLRVSYRQKLYLDLVDIAEDGAIDYYIDFVGRFTNGQNAIPSFDASHEGQGGTTADEIASEVPTAFSENPADVVLLHIGTNDMDDGAGAINQTISDVNSVLNNIWLEAPNATVILAQIINRWPFEQSTSDFNDALRTMADGRIANGEKLVLVDMESALNYPADMDNAVYSEHPNPGGYQKMADKWYTALAEILPPSNEAFPIITSEGGIKDANIGEVFSFDVESDGNPPPTFSFVVFPSPDASIDANSGLIQWTPSATGIYDVTVQAQNFIGSDNQSFQIDVNSPPTAVPDQYGPVSQGGVISVAATAGVLVNDSDADDDPFVAILISNASNGSVNLNSDGSFQYQHNQSATSSDSFSYRATDGVGQSSVTTVSLSINMSSGGGGGGGGCFIMSTFH
jgi:VCBS repeat-containing protein